MAKFRFEDLEIWQEAIQIGNELYDVADRLDGMKKYRFAEQLRAAALSISNNIAEGSGGTKPEFNRYLSIARSSLYENVNMLKVFELREYITSERCSNLITRLDKLSRQITSFRRSLE